MKKLVIPIIIITALSSCIVEVDLTPSNIIVGNINEYESREVVNEIWSNGKLLYEEYYYRAYLEIEFINTGGATARNITADVSFNNGAYHIKDVTVRFPKIHAGDTYIYSFDTGFESMYDYTDYEVAVYWD